MNGYFYIEEGENFNTIHVLNKNNIECCSSFCKGDWLLGYCYCLKDLGFKELTHEEVKRIQEKGEVKC